MDAGSWTLTAALPPPISASSDNIVTNRQRWEEPAVYRERVEVDEHQAGGHDKVCHQGEGGQVLQVGGEDQQDDGGQEAEHVEAGVEARHQHLGLVGVVHLAAEGGSVGCFDHLRERIE